MDTSFTRATPGTPVVACLGQGAGNFFLGNDQKARAGRGRVDMEEEREGGNGEGKLGRGNGEGEMGMRATGKGRQGGSQQGGRDGEGGGFHKIS